MDDNIHFQIKASSIKPLKRKRKPDYINTYTNYLNINKVRVLPLPIISTDELQTKHTLPHPIVSVAEMGSGLVEVIRSAKLSPGGNVDVKIVDSVTVGGWIADGRHPPNDVVVITKLNRVCPCYIPDLSDLALLPSPLKIMVRSLLLKEGGKGGIGVQHTIIPKSIMSIIYPPSVLPNCNESCSLVSGEHNISMYSYSNDLKLFNTNCGVKLSQVRHESTPLSANKLDGRKINMSFTVTGDSHAVRGARYVVWNCRHMAHNSFLPNICKLIEMNMPDAIFLTETRVSVHIARIISRHLNAYRVRGEPTVGVNKGIVIITFTKEVKFEMEGDNEMNCNIWTVHHEL